MQTEEKIKEKAFVERVIEIAKMAGSFIAREAVGFKQDKVEEKKGYSDLVSYVDKEAEKMLVTALNKLLPEAGFLAEEGTGGEVQGDWLWVIDPLDGTTNFIHGLPVYAVSIALLHQGQARLGVVYEINKSECFSAVEGMGAFLNGRPIAVSQTDALEGTLLATGFPYYDFARMDEYMPILRAFMETTRGLRRLGSAAVDLAYVACGRFDGYFEYNLNAWDVAAGVLIVKEAGGSVTDLKGGDDYIFGREVLAAGAIHPEMLRVITDHWDR
ncbi:MAG: inositol monophosphatase [Cyclobacteriaceae bacterium]|nr:inositol monophosphatase [Cyclobacteriaceae bacterium]